MHKKTLWSGILLPLLLVGSCLLVGAQGPDLLKYKLKVTPGNLTVDRMPATSPPKSYEEDFAFSVTNATRADFHGSAPTSQTFDVEVFFVGIDKDILVWKWSASKMFGQSVTPVPISAGKTWTPEEKVVWSFTAAEVKNGKYHAVTTFIPTGNKKAVADFTITSAN